MEQKQKTWIRVFKHEYVCTYIGLHVEANCMLCILQAYLCVQKHAYADMPKEP